MNTVIKLVFLSCAPLAFACGVQAGRSEFSYAIGLPARKKPVEVVVRRNPFQAALEPDRPLPVLRDKDDPATKLPVLLTPHIRSVIRDPRPLLLMDGVVVQPGDEVRLGKDGLLPKYRVVLKSIESDRLIFHLTSQDPQQPGQVETMVLLSAGMRKN